MSLLTIYLRETLARYKSGDSTPSVISKNDKPKCPLTEWGKWGWGVGNGGASSDNSHLRSKEN